MKVHLAMCYHNRHTLQSSPLRLASVQSFECLRDWRDGSGGFTLWPSQSEVISLLPLSPLEHQIIHVSLYSASTQYLKGTSKVQHGSSTSLILCSTFLGQEWFVYLNCMHRVSVFPQGLKQSSPPYWLADAFWGPEQLFRIQPCLFNGNQGWSMYNLYTCFEWFITNYFGMEPICFIKCICLFIELLGRGKKLISK